MDQVPGNTLLVRANFQYGPELLLWLPLAIHAGGRCSVHLQFRDNRIRAEKMAGFEHAASKTPPGLCEGYESEE